MILKDLNELAIQSKNQFLGYNNSKDYIFSDEFRSSFKDLLENTTTEKISFAKYTCTINTQTGLTINLPNQWFIIAFYFVPFAKELKVYKECFVNIFKDLTNLKEEVKQIKDSGNIPASINPLIDQYFDNEEDASRFRKFLTNYSWWYGSKYINRSDFYVSPILSLANVVNGSQGYIAEISFKLAENDFVYEILKKQILNEAQQQEENKSQKVIYQSDSIREFALFVFNHFYSKSWNSLLESSEVKLASINNLSFNSFDIGVFKRLVAEFNSLASKEELTSSGTLRYFEEPIFEKDNKYYFFSTQWNGDGQRDLNFVQLKTYFESKFPLYSIEKLNNVYKLIEKNMIGKIFFSELHNSGLFFNLVLVNRFIASLCTKQFLILTGLSGSGKTKLAQAFATWISESNDQYLLVPVGADWTNREPLLGYPNSLEPQKYVTPESGVIQIITKSIENPDKPYFLILDEMNLSHVERYFADFLSAMESKESIKLYSDSDRYTKFDNDNKPVSETRVLDKFKLPSNLFIIGTVNIDETTYMFSPKVLDRANTIEFRLTEDDLDLFFQNSSSVKLSNLHEGSNESMPGLGFNQSKIFMDLVNKSNDKIDYSRIGDVLKTFFINLKNAGAEFG